MRRSRRQGPCRIGERGPCGIDEVDPAGRDPGGRAARARPEHAADAVAAVVLKRQWALIRQAAEAVHPTADQIDRLDTLTPAAGDHHEEADTRLLNR